MNSISVLKSDHRLIEKVIGSLEGIVHSIEKGKVDIDPKYIERLKKILQFSQVFIDRCHHGKEESCLFPCLEKLGIPREGGPIGVMLEEHESGRMLVRQIDETVRAYCNTPLQQHRDMLLSLCNKYVRLLTQHIFKEDNVLFNLADQVMSAEDERKVLLGFDQIELERVGLGTHEEMHRLSDEILKETP